MDTMRFGVTTFSPTFTNVRRFGQLDRFEHLIQRVGFGESNRFEQHNARVWM